MKFHLAGLTVALSALASSRALAQCETHVFLPTAPDAEWFGLGTSASGDLVTISNAGEPLGYLAVLHRDLGKWQLEAELADPHDEEWSAFGQAFQLFGDTLVVTAPDSDLRTTNEGAAYVYARDGGRWNLVQELRPEESLIGARFGYSVAFDDDTLVIGASGAQVDGLSEAGRVFVYSKKDGAWGSPQQLASTRSMAHTYFGKRVALWGDRLYVTHYLAQVVLEYTRVEGVWTLTHTFEPVNDTSTSFGDSLTVRDDLLAVGAPQGYIDGVSSGHVTLFRRIRGAWQSLGLLVPPEPAPIMSAGNDCAILPESHDILVGAPFAIVDGVLAGSVFVYGETNGAWTLKETIVPSEAAEVGMFGASVNNAGDEVLVGQLSQSILLAGFDDSDCNANGEPDACDIAGGTSLDANFNGIPDECELAADLDGDGVVGSADLALLLGSWGGRGAADLDGDGFVGATDLTILLGAWTE